jgi:hypothetical protein
MTLLFVVCVRGKHPEGVQRRRRPSLRTWYRASKWVLRVECHPVTRDTWQINCACVHTLLSRTTLHPILRQPTGTHRTIPFSLLIIKVIIITVGAGTLILLLAASLIFLGLGTRFWKLASPLLQPRITWIRRLRASGSQTLDSMVIGSEKPLYIHLDIPNSPFLLTLPSDADSQLSASAPPTPSCSTLSSELMPFPKMSPTHSSSSSSSSIRQPLHSVPEITITSALSGASLNGRPTSPPCASQHPKPRLSAFASKKLVEFIDFLEKVDRDMASEIEHVKGSIREAREYVGEWQEDRSTRCAELLRTRREEGETKELESDF